MKIAFVSTWCPYPLDNGSRIRQYYLLRHLAERHAVTLFTFLPGEEWRASLPVLESFCQKVIAVPSKAYRPLSPRAILGLLSPMPRFVTATFSQEMSRLIRQETCQTDYDVFIAGEIGGAIYVRSARARAAILDDPELAVLYDRLLPTQRVLTRWRHSLTRLKFERFMRSILECFDACTVVSEPERELLRFLAPPQFPIEIVPNGVDTDHNCTGLATPRPNSLVFSGSLHYYANWEAVDFFLREIYPRIRLQIPGVSLTVTGRHDGRLPGTAALREGVTFTDFVEDVRPYVAGSAVAIVPLRQGGGTRLKVLEAMALGVPVVSTTKGVEGLDVKPEQHVLVADEPADFAAAVVRLLEDNGLRQFLVTEARQLVETRYDWKMIGRKMNRLVENLLIAGKSHECTC